MIVKSLDGSGNGMVTVDNNGKLIQLPFTGNATDVLLGNGTFGASPSGLWSAGTGSKIYYNSGKVGIGTSTPNFLLDVNGDARITNNLYLQGQLIISDKIQTPKQMKAGSIVVDSLLMDSTRAVYGTATFVNDVKVQSKLAVNGNATINGTATVNGDLKTMGSFIFAGDKKISYTPATGGSPAVMSFGFAPRPPGPCFLNPAVTALNQFVGLLQSFDGSSTTATNLMTMGFDGANGILDVAGPSSKLLLNYSCGHDVAICTGALGGKTDISSGPQGGNVNICSGATGNVIMANNVGPRVGIATDLPGAKLEIRNNDPSIPSVIISKYESPTQTRKIIFEPKLNVNDYNGLTQANDAGMFWSDGADGASRNSNAGFVIAPWPNSVLGTYTPGIRITSNGTVGIGIANPQAMLDVQNVNVLRQTGIKVTNRFTDEGSETGIGVLSVVANALNKTFVGAVGDGSTNVENFVVYGDGYVQARDIKVTLQPIIHPDYVFAKGYDLMPLSTLETYLKDKNHLPNIPSAKEVKANNGIDLGEMSEKQLEKIEELTLYIIEMNKKINELATTVQIQQEQIQTLKNK